MYLRHSIILIYLENHIIDYNVMYKIFILFIITAFIIKYKSIIIINITS